MSMPCRADLRRACFWNFNLLEVMIVKICFLLLSWSVAEAKAKMKAKTKAQPKCKATVSMKGPDSCSCPSIDEKVVLSFKAIHSFSHLCM